VARERGGDLAHDRLRSHGHSGVLGREPRLDDILGVHPARALLPGRSTEKIFEESLTAGDPRGHVLNPGPLIQLDSLRASESVIDGGRELVEEPPLVRGEDGREVGESDGRRFVRCHVPLTDEILDARSPLLHAP
jgi:hypothetical protein